MTENEYYNATRNLVSFSENDPDDMPPGVGVPVNAWPPEPSPVHCLFDDCDGGAQTDDLPLCDEHVADPQALWLMEQAIATDPDAQHWRASAWRALGNANVYIAKFNDAGDDADDARCAGLWLALFGDDYAKAIND